MSTEDKWMPKVGEEFECRHQNYSAKWFSCGKVLGETDKQLAYLTKGGSIGILSKSHQFQPIQTKADIEREQLIAILRKNYMLSEGGVQSIQEAGFTIPKKVKRSDVSALISDWTDLPNVLTSEICNLLGDLVEQDQ